MEDRDNRMVLAGGLLTLFGSLSAMCNSLASHEFGKDFHQVVGQVTSSKVKTSDGSWDSVSFIDWDSVGDTITRVHDTAGSTSRGVQGQDSLDGNV